MMLTSFDLVTTASLLEDLTSFCTEYIIILIMCDKMWLPEQNILVGNMKSKRLRGVSLEEGCDSGG